MQTEIVCVVEGGSVRSIYCSDRHALVRVIDNDVTEKASELEEEAAEVMMEVY